MSRKFSKYDKVQCNNLIIALRKAKFDLDGQEVIAFSEVLKWVNSIYNEIEVDMQEEIKPPMKVKADKQPLQEPPKAVSKVKGKKGK